MCLCFKVIRLLGSRAQREKDLKAFERELAIVCSLRHPNIVCVYGAVFRPTELWLVMDLAEEGNLREYIEALSGKEDLSVELENRLDFARGCTAALAFLHGKDIQHRDVKSPNVLLARNNRGKLIAKVLPSSSLLVSFSLSTTKSFRTIEKSIESFRLWSPAS